MVLVLESYYFHCNLAVFDLKTAKLQNSSELRHQLSNAKISLTVVRLLYLVVVLVVVMML